MTATTAAPRRAPRRTLGLALAALGALAALAGAPNAGADERTPGPAGGDAPVTVRAPAAAPGDGRSVIAVAVEPPAPGAAARGPHDAAVLECPGAAVLAAVPGRAAAVLAPAVSRAKRIECKALLGGAEGRFAVTLDPPRAGLYASAEPPAARADAASVAFTLFRVEPDGRVGPPAAPRAGSSAGPPSVRGDRAVVDLPQSRVPRTLVVAFLDGDQAGAAFVPVTGFGELPVEAEPGSEVELRIAGRTFGPVKTEGGRRVRIPIEVPAGVHRGTVRAVDRKGFVTETTLDLEVPDMPRLAAVAARTRVGPGEHVTIAVAAADADGRPAPASAALAVRARRGALDRPRALADGLFLVTYTAPSAAGDDRIVVGVEGDRGAGKAELTLSVQAGEPRELALTLPPGPVGPGEPIEGLATVLDDEGRPLVDDELRVRVDGRAAETTATPEGVRFRATAPRRLPASGRLTVEVEAGALRRGAVVPLRAGPPETAEVTARPGRRGARVRVEVRDRHGNLVAPDAFAWTVRGARAGALARQGDAYVTDLVAEGDLRQADVEIAIAGAAPRRWQVPLARTRTAALGVYGEGGWASAAGDLSAPRLGAGALVALDLTWLELALGLGVEGRLTGGADDVRLLGVPVLARARLRLTDRLGASVGAALVPIWVDATVAPGTASEARHRELDVSLRWRVGLDAALGPGRLGLGLGQGTAIASAGPIAGRIDDWALTAAYEWWLLTR